MLWNPFGRRRDTTAELFRRQHSSWLTRAFRRPEGSVPRIPVRRVDEGGYSTMLNRPGGRERAAMWWTLALDRVDD